MGDGVIPQRPAAKIAQAKLSRLTLQCPVKIQGCRLVDLQQLPADVPVLPLPGTLRPAFRQRIAHLVRQPLQRLLKGNVLIIHQKAEGISALAAAEAVKNLLPRCHGKGGGLLAVKRTEPEIVGALLLQGHVIADNVHDIDPGAHLIHDFV